MYQCTYTSFHVYISTCLTGALAEGEFGATPGQGSLHGSRVGVPGHSMASGGTPGHRAEGLPGGRGRVGTPEGLRGHSMPRKYSFVPGRSASFWWPSGGLRNYTWCSRYGFQGARRIVRGSHRTIRRLGSPWSKVISPSAVNAGSYDAMLAHALDQPMVRPEKVVRTLHSD